MYRQVGWVKNEVTKENCEKFLNFEYLKSPSQIIPNHFYFTQFQSNFQLSVFRQVYSIYVCVFKIIFIIFRLFFFNMKIKSKELFKLFSLLLLLLFIISIIIIIIIIIKNIKLFSLLLLLYYLFDNSD